MGKNLINILIADDTQIALEGLRSILKTADDIRLVGETDSIFSIPRLVRELSPDLLIMDLKWEGDGSAGWIKIREIKDKYPEVKIIALTAYEGLISDARNAGADEVFTKNFRTEELINLIHELAKSQISRKPMGANTNSKAETLTPREIDVLKLLDKGLSDKELSDALNIEVNTVKNHVKSILQKLNVENRRKAPIKTREEGLLK